MVFEVQASKKHDSALCSTFARIYRIEPRLKEAQMILSLSSNTVKLYAQMVVRVKQTKNTMLRCALRFARMYRIEPRLKEAQTILSLGSNDSNW